MSGRKSRKRDKGLNEDDDDSSVEREELPIELKKRKTDEKRKRPSSCARSMGTSAGQRLPQQKTSKTLTSVSMIPLQNNNFNDNRQSDRSTNGSVRSQSNIQPVNFKSKVRRNLIEEMDAIDAEFEPNGNQRNVLAAPDGIKIAVDMDEEQEFNEQLDYEDETVVPVPNDEDSDAETIEGEDYLNDSLSSSTVITFKPCNPFLPPGDLDLDALEIVSEKKGDGQSKKIEDMTPDELVKANPALKEWMDDMMAKKNKKTPKSKLDKRTIRTSVKNTGNREVLASEVLGEQYNSQFKQPQMGTGRGTDDMQIRVNNRTVPVPIKSPSDTTVYAPALKLTPEMPNKLMPSMEHRGTQAQSQSQTSPGGDGERGANEMVSQFLDQVRESSRRSFTQPPPQPSTSAARNVRNHAEEAEWDSQEMHAQAERYKARVDIPQGMATNYMNAPQANEVNNMICGPMQIMNNHQGMNNLNSALLQGEVNHPYPLLGRNNVENAIKDKPVGITDDEFFHLTCHVDPNIKQKIERGEFVDLEKLLVKDRLRSNNVGQRMELVSRGGETFIMPADRENKITNVRKWEQAFRIYAAIYSQANPHRSSEIWQYVYVINSAATTYVWENVSNYDYTFRQLMACNPLRNWSNIYHQMWNLTMRDTIPKNNFQFGQSSSDSAKRNGKRGDRKKPSYCWSFNRGEKCKFEPNCRFVKRCSYCDTAGHGQFECPKLKEKKK